MWINSMVIFTLNVGDRMVLGVGWYMCVSNEKCLYYDCMYVSTRREYWEYDICMYEDIISLIGSLEFLLRTACLGKCEKIDNS